ncbi:Crp/Fnr family transcriptional regulator [Nocardiopsis chromatogenes]|uniref:Crp/Fnr family transcriptional regulator n=1 Tax=Nocardiopsis chromatogenes TaxID=280239 RepID=UPI00308412F2
MRLPRRGLGGLLDDRQWARLLAEGARARFSPGEALMRQGDPGSTVHLLAEGHARVVRVRADGTTVPLAFRAAGDVLGEPMLVPGGGERSATVTAVGPCATAVFPAERFRRIVGERGLESALWESTLARQMESDALRAEQAALPAEQRLPVALLYLARALGVPTAAPITDGPGPGRRAVLVRIPLPQREIAEFAGLSRTSVAAAYTRMRQRGLIRTGRSYVAVLDMAALEALAEGGD